LGISDLNIPVELYRGVRSGSLLRNAGTHVFGGVITTVAENYNANSGVYTTRVNGSNNLYWLDQSRVNRVPSLDQTQGVLEDPLTAFDIQTDPATGLITGLTENAPMNSVTQGRIDAGLINNNAGVRAGESFERGTYVQDYFDNGDGTFISQFKHAPGIECVKWK
jgi:hypothetical protein